MKDIFITIIKYITAILGENGVPSSKRWLGFIITLVVLKKWSDSVDNNGLGANETMLAEVLIGVAGILLGISTAVKAFNKGENNNG